MSERKTIHFQVQVPLYERFVKSFPGYGERSKILRKALTVIVRMEEEKQSFEEEFSQKWKTLNG